MVNIQGTDNITTETDSVKNDIPTGKLVSYWFSNFTFPIDLFPNWRNSVQIATLQMIGHRLLSTNF